MSEGMQSKLLFRDSGMQANLFGMDGRVCFVYLLAILSFSFKGLFFSFFLIIYASLFCFLLGRMRLTPYFLWLKLKNWTFGPVRRIETSWSYHNKRSSSF